MPQLTSTNLQPTLSMTTTLFTAILASGLALALSREHRIRRAFQSLASRLLDKLRRQDHAATTKLSPHSPRRHA